MSKFKVAIYGSAGSQGTDKNISLFERAAVKIGKKLAKQGCIVITGACTGLPYIAAEGAVKSGGEAWGFAAASSRKVLDKTTPRCNNDIYSKLVYVPNNLKYLKDISVARKFRNVTSAAYSDAGIIISGLWGTMSEFTHMYDFGKVIGVLKGSGGVADELPGLLKRLKKPSKAVVIFEKSPEKLVQKVLGELKKRSFQV